MSGARHTDEEINALASEAKALSVRLDVVIDNLLFKVMERLRDIGEGTAGRDDALDALAELQSVRDDYSGAGSRSQSNHSPTESSERPDGGSTESRSS